MTNQVKKAITELFISIASTFGEVSQLSRTDGFNRLAQVLVMCNNTIHVIDSSISARQWVIVLAQELLDLRYDYDFDENWDEYQQAVSDLHSLIQATSEQ